MVIADRHHRVCVATSRRLHPHLLESGLACSPSLTHHHFRKFRYWVGWVRGIDLTTSAWFLVAYWYAHMSAPTLLASHTMASSSVSKLAWTCVEWIVKVACQGAPMFAGLDCQEATYRLPRNILCSSSTVVRAAIAWDVASPFMRAWACLIRSFARSSFIWVFSPVSMALSGEISSFAVLPAGLFANQFPMGFCFIGVGLLGGTVVVISA